MDKIEKYHKDFARYNQIRKAFFKWYFKIYHRLEVIGLDKVPDGPALVATNHSGGFDLDIVALSDCAHPDRQIHGLIAENWHFINSNWGKYWVGGGIPLWTRGGIRWEYIDPYLKEGGKHYPSLVSIYPEGHSGLFKERYFLNKFFPGVVRIALHYQVPIVPVGMVGFQKASPILAEIERDHGPNDPILLPFTFPFKLKIEFGKPFELNDYYGQQLTKEEEFKISNNIVRPKVHEILERHGKTVMKDV
jgi:1-acyl-sn-glycerol-3-phosphate acyltransferase